MSAENRVWLSFFKAQGGLVDGAEDQPLRSVCPDAGSCWSGFGPTEVTDWAMPRPWVGPRYAEGRVVGFGQNLWDWGGWSAIEQCVTTVRPFQERGFTRKTGLGDPKKYRTPFWSFAVAYLTVLTNRFRSTTVREPMGDIRAASATWDLVAFSEVVKCAPGRGRSEPSFQMLGCCPARFAVRELAVLEPRPLAGVVIGTNAAFALASAAGATPMREGHFCWWRTRGTYLFGVPHPARPGFSRRSLVADFAALVTAVLPVGT